MSVAPPPYEEAIQEPPVYPIARADGQPLQDDDIRAVRQLLRQRQREVGSDTVSTTGLTSLVSDTTSSRGGGHRHRPTTTRPPPQPPQRQPAPAVTPTSLPQDRRPKRLRRRVPPSGQRSEPDQRSLKAKISACWDRIMAKMPPQVQRQHAPRDLQREVNRRRMLDTLEFVGYVVLMGVCFAVVVVSFVAILVLI